MSTIPTAPVPVPRPQPLPSGPAGARPAGPAGTRPTGGATSHPRMLPSDPATTAAHRRRLVAAFVALFLEVEAGCRPSRHLAPLLAPMLYARLSRVWYRGGQPGQVVSVSVIGSEPDAFDAVAVVRRGPRSGAVSLRLALGPGRWRVEELARPEDGPLPGPAHRVALDDDGDDDDATIPEVLLRSPVAPVAAGAPVTGDRDGAGHTDSAAVPTDRDWVLPASSR